MNRPAERRVTRQYVQPKDATQRRVVSSVRVSSGHGYDYVAVWTRGQRAGELVVAGGDGADIAEAVASAFGLQRVDYETGAPV